MLSLHAPTNSPTTSSNSSRVHTRGYLLHMQSIRPHIELLYFETLCFWNYHCSHRQSFKLPFSTPGLAKITPSGARRKESQKVESLLTQATYLGCKNACDSWLMSLNCRVCDCVASLQKSAKTYETTLEQVQVRNIYSNNCLQRKEHICNQFGETCYMIICCIMHPWTCFEAQVHAHAATCFLHTSKTSRKASSQKEYSYKQLFFKVFVS